MSIITFWGTFVKIEIAKLPVQGKHFLVREWEFSEHNKKNFLHMFVIMEICAWEKTGKIPHTKFT